MRYYRRVVHRSCREYTTRRQQIFVFPYINNSISIRMHCVEGEMSLCRPIDTMYDHICCHWQGFIQLYLNWITLSRVLLVVCSLCTVAVVCMWPPLWRLFVCMSPLWMLFVWNAAPVAIFVYPPHLAVVLCMSAPVAVPLVEVSWFWNKMGRYVASVQRMLNVRYYFVREISKLCVQYFSGTYALMHVH